MKMHGLTGAPSVDDTQATFDGPGASTDVTYVSTSEGLKEDITLPSPPPANTNLRYSYTISTSAQITPQLQLDGSVAFLRANGGVAFSMPKGTMRDSSEDPQYSSNVAFELTQAGDHVWTLTVLPDMQWLTASSRNYPVVIDPTINNALPATDCTIRLHNPTSNACGNGADYLRAGRHDSTTRFRGLLDFDLSSIPSTSTVTTAQVQLYLDSRETFSTLSADYGLFKAGRRFNRAATWNTSGASGGWSGGDPTGSALASLTMRGGDSGYKNFNKLADAFDGFVKNPGTWNGLVLKQLGETVDNELAFYSSSTNSTNDGYRPRLTLDYNRAPDAPADIRALDQDPLSAVVFDSDGGTLTAMFELRDGATRVWTGSSTPVASGSRATVAVPYDQLAAGKRYAVYVRGFDGRNYSSYASTTLVTDPDAVLLADAQKLATAAFRRDAAIWEQGKTALAGSTVAASDSLAADGIPAEYATQLTSQSAPAIESHADSVLSDQSALARDDIAVPIASVDPRVESAERTAPDTVVVKLNVTTTQDEIDNSTDDGQMYVDGAGSLTPMDDFLPDPEPADDPSEENAASWTDAYRATFSVQPTQVMGVDGQLHNASYTPTLTAVEMTEPAEFTENGVGPVDPPPASPDPAMAMDTTRPTTAAVARPSASVTKSYHRRAAAKYARNWTAGDKLNELNPDYPHDPDDNNCANFVSQALHEGGGWPTEGGLLDTPKSKDAWDWDLPVIGVGSTWTWVNAGWLYYYEFHRKNLDWIRNLWNAVKGETLFWDWDGDGKIDHANIVSGRTKKGVPRISQKSTGRHNMVLSLWLKKYVVPEHPNYKVWGLHYYER